ncbi:hypothetical protein [Arthrobacter mobilis]|uniref:Uncharacterized protein n=1 Tax=Arthrobacter mobilis TaxID=2724944 RepID=A0A7X6K842_9MICC|nr:hypothetical protein [Arthrobacter mobilis]NKX56876.1 hypothetical protein [Arthrobacter mobilis]
MHLQNTRDGLHMREHLRPFLANVHPLNSVYFLQDNWGEDHAVPPKELFTQVLEAAAATDWSESLTKLGFSVPGFRLTFPA